MPVVAVKGLRELQRDFKKLSLDLSTQLQEVLVRAADPVRDAAEQLAVQEISHIGLEWSAMRIGVTSQAVYVAPQARRKAGRGSRNRRRPNLAPLLLHKAMEPALEQREAEVAAMVGYTLDMLADRAGF